MANFQPKSLPSEQDIRENHTAIIEEMVERKSSILTELAAIDGGINLLDFITTSRDSLPSSFCSVPCDIQFITAKKYTTKQIDHFKCAEELANAIIDVATHPSEKEYNEQKKETLPDVIVHHSEKFFNQIDQNLENKKIFNDGFVVLTKVIDPDTEKPEPEPYISHKSPHPFFPEIVNVGPLLGPMKTELGEYPPYVIVPPSDEEAAEQIFLANDKSYRDHLFDLVGSSSDDDFEPDTFIQECIDGIPPRAPKV